MSGCTKGTERSMQRARIVSEKLKSSKQCKCGCGKNVKSNRMYISGHNGKKWNKEKLITEYLKYLPSSKRISTQNLPSSLQNAIPRYFGTYASSDLKFIIRRKKIIIEK